MLIKQSQSRPAFFFRAYDQIQCNKMMIDFWCLTPLSRLAAASDKVYQLLAHGQWISPGTPASSTTKTGRHDIAEILLKVALNTKNQSSSPFL
jgi:hypothetical protein